MNTERKDVYTEITNEIIAALESGCDEWKRPWHGVNVMPKNALTGGKYRGVNVLLLWILSQKLGYQDSLWGTYRQWRELGAQVKKGEKSCPVVFWKCVDSDEAEEDSDEQKGKHFLFAKTYHVFNVSQVDGYDPGVHTLAEDERIGHAETFFRSLNFIVSEAESAFYRRDEDTVYMPPFSKFHNKEGYYSVLAHEVTHWTGHESRLNRDLSGRFGEESYAMEELVAELGAAFLCADLEVTSSVREDHASYVQNWLKVLKEDKRAIFSAASKAQQAVDWMATASEAQRKAA